MMHVSGTTLVARVVSEAPRIRVAHGGVPPGVGLQARAWAAGDEADVRGVTVEEGAGTVWASVVGHVGERLVLVVEATGTGTLQVTEVVAGLGPEEPAP